MDIRQAREKIFQLKGKIKRVALLALEVEGVKSVQKNFDTGGRPKWKPSRKIGRRAAIKHGNKTLIDSGKLRRINSQTSGNAVILSTDPLTRQYARVHQEGGQWAVPSRKQKRSIGSGRYASNSRVRGVTDSTAGGGVVNMPARPYMVIPEEDFSRILKAVGTAIKMAMGN